MTRDHHHLFPQFITLHTQQAPNSHPPIIPSNSCYKMSMMAASRKGATRTAGNGDGDGDDHNDDNDDALRQTIAALAPALEILDRFHHRNRNQHRLSRWWAEADMLRRHAHKLLAAAEARRGALEAAAAAAAAAAATRRKKKQRRVEDEPCERDLGVRAGFVCAQLVPRAYLAFTQLAADRQFAHLGLMLLGILAQIDAAAVPFAPKPPSPDTSLSSPSHSRRAAAAATAQPDRAAATKAASPTGTGMVHSHDTGEAVSRDAVTAMLLGAVPAETRPRSPPSQPNTTMLSRLPPAGQPNDNDDDDEPRNTAAVIAAASGINSSSSKDVDRMTKKKKKKKKDPKRGGGDEFDDIFGSL
ncbi:hypothetical protein B0T24DRAFT_190601 [Lasiosphaeria ovina]|uniref:RNase MRP protein 1 RNA binding domain-containing protein n=1 Tax=Lasiosphaeria ovina TaxID=92902 RepID=A0AAE0NF33_9PEZI|nr:hypothetical protein B0T24DRAFT_190601 [Lasiosphaeria ovina]